MNPLSEPLGGPLPLPVDAVRDFWDWVMVFGGVASFVAAVVAIYLAVQANQAAERANETADKAMAEAASAERRAIERAAAERRALFELEILRDLLEAIDERRLATEFAGAMYPARFFTSTLEGRLSMLPRTDLPFWRSFPRMTNEERWALFPEVPKDQIDSSRESARLSGGWRIPDQYIPPFRGRLRADVLASIESRMAVLGDLPTPTRNAASGGQSRTGM